MIVLIGFMGAGKTTIGRLLAERLGLPFVDSDLVIEHERRRSVAEIFAESGEDAFRRIEERTIRRLLGGPTCVLSLGGGACGAATTRDLLRRHTVIYLHVDLHEAMHRVGGDSYRPLLGDPALPSLYDARLAVYAETAGLTSYTTGRRVEDVALEIIDRLTDHTLRDGSHGVLVAPPGGSYRVHVGRGLVAQLPHLLPVLPESGKVVVVSGPGDGPTGADVTALLSARAAEVHHLRLPAGVGGRTDKTLSAVAATAEQMAAAAVHRGDLLVGVGDEATCDVVGFLGATYNRGLAHALVPTTLEAQADSAVGGRCSLDLPPAGNLLGLVHQPVLVACDVDLATGPDAVDYASGLAEIVKHGLVADSGLLTEISASSRAVLDRDPATMATLVRRSVEIKADIVTSDEREQGDRAHLGYGHTFSRAFASADPGCADTALALGLMAAAHLGRRMGWLSGADVDTHRRVLEALQLPTSASFTLDQLAWTLERDKKYRQGWRFVVLRGLGRPAADALPTQEELEGALRDLAAT